VVRFDRVPIGIDLAAIAHPSISLRQRPLVEAEAIARLIALAGVRSQAELSTRSVQEQIIGLVYVVDTGSRGSRLDHMHLDLESRAQALAGCRNDPLERADPPWS
jgi:hypothetical protein